MAILVFRGYNDNSISLNVRDYLYAGDVGTEFEYASTKVYTDTNGIVKISHDTVTWVKVKKDTLHSIGAIEVRMDVKSKEKIEKPYETFLGFYQNTIRRKILLVDAPKGIILKHPIKTGEKWGEGHELISTIMTIDEAITTPYKSIKTVRVERAYSETFRNIVYNYIIKDYLAPNLLEVRTEYVYTKTYRSKKIERTETITNLIRYSEKLPDKYFCLCK